MMATRPLHERPRRGLRARAALCFAALMMLLAGACEGLIGIREPSAQSGVDFGPDAGGPVGELDASAGGDIDAALPVERLQFEPIEIGCVPGTAHRVALGRSEPGSPQDRTIFALDENSLWVCRDPFGGGQAEQIVLESSEAQAMWVGDVTGNGTDDVVIVSEFFVYLITFGPEGDWDGDILPTETTEGSEPVFVTGADLDGNGLTDVAIARTSIAVVFQDVEGFFESFQNVTPPLEHAVFAPMSQPFRPDLIALADIDGRTELMLRYAEASEPHYERETRFPINGPTGFLAAATDPSGIVSYVAVSTTDGLAIFPRIADTFADPDYLLVDLGGPLAAGDLLGDGVDDLVGVRPSDRQGGLVLSQEVTHGQLPMPDQVNEMVIADVNGDGLADILIAGSTGVRVLLRSE
jgi:hypothetical protein